MSDINPITSRRHPPTSSYDLNGWPLDPRHAWNWDESTVLPEPARRIKTGRKTERTSGALRQERWRQRQVAGEIVLRISVLEDDLIVALQATGWLSRGEAADRERMAAALSAMLNDWTDAWRK